MSLHTFQHIMRRFICSNPKSNLRISQQISKYCSHCEGYKAVTQKKSKDNEVKYYPQTFLDKLLNRRRIRKKPPKECCKRAVCNRDPEEQNIPEYVKEMVDSNPGSEVIKTSGSAYIVKIPKNLKKIEVKKKSKTDILISKIETESKPQSVEDAYNPMPEYCNPCLRMIELQSRNLHPLYQKYEAPPLPKRRFIDFTQSDIIVKKKKNVGRHLFTSDCETYPNKQMHIQYKMAELPRTRLKRTTINVYGGMDIRIVKKVECLQKGKYHFTKCPQPVCSKEIKTKTKKDKN